MRISFDTYDCRDMVVIEFGKETVYFDTKYDTLWDNGNNITMILKDEIEPNLNATFKGEPVRVINFSFKEGKVLIQDNYSGPIGVYLEDYNEDELSAIMKTMI